MKLTISGFEVEIKAKDTVLGHEKFSQDDTKSFLLYLATACSHASAFSEGNGYTYSAKWENQAFMDIADNL